MKDAVGWVGGLFAFIVLALCIKSCEDSSYLSSHSPDFEVGQVVGHCLGGQVVIREIRGNGAQKTIEYLCARPDGSTAWVPERELVFREAQ